MFFSKNNHIALALIGMLILLPSTQAIPASYAAEPEIGKAIFQNLARPYILAPSAKRGVLFEYDMIAPPPSSIDSTADIPSSRDDQESVNKNSVNKNSVVDDSFGESAEATIPPLEGFIGTTSRHEPSPELQALVPTLDQMGEVIKGKVESSGVDLKSEDAKSDTDRQRSLIAEAFLNHGTLGLLLITSFTGTLEVYRVLKGSPAEFAGIKPGDKIIQIGTSRITGTNIDIKSVYHMLTGYRGQYRTLKIARGIHTKTIHVPLWGIYDFRDRRSQYIEYYWYLLYHNLIGPKEYEKKVAPFLYFTPPKVRPLKKTSHKAITDSEGFRLV